MQRADLKRLEGGQLRLVLEFAQQLHFPAREPFMAAVAAALADVETLGNGVVTRTCRAVIEGQKLHVIRKVQL